MNIYLTVLKLTNEKVSHTVRIKITKEYFFSVLAEDELATLFHVSHEINFQRQVHITLAKKTCFSPQSV